MAAEALRAPGRFGKPGADRPFLEQLAESGRRALATAARFVADAVATPPDAFSRVLVAAPL